MSREIFTNEQVFVDDLPAVEQIDFIPIEKEYRTIQLIAWTIFFIIVIVGMNIAFWQAEAPLIPWLSAVCGWIALGALQYVVIFRAHRFKGFALRRYDLTYRKGWLYKKEVTVPYRRIQHVDVKQGFIERQFGLAKLNLYTAGGNSSDLTVPGLRDEDAQQFKSYIIGVMRNDEEE